MDDRTRYVEDLKAFVRRNEPGLVETLSDLIRARTVNPPGDEELAARVVLDRLSRSGMGSRTFAPEPGRTSVVTEVGPETPRVLVAAHLDVVPAGEGWTSDPFEPVVREGRVYGRGACDNKGVAACLLALLPFLQERAGELSAGGIFAFVADEERGSLLGMEHLACLGLFDGVSGALIPDSPHNLDTVFISEKGLLVVDVLAHGKAAHGSTPELGSNAILHMFALLGRLDELGIARASHPLHSPATYNVGTIEGGDAPNIVPSKCTAQIDFRYLPDQSADEIVEGVRRLAEEVAAGRSEASFDVRVATSLPPARVTKDAAIVRAVQRATLTIVGREPAVDGMSGTTVAKQLIVKGIPAVSLAPGDPHVPHTSDEYVSIEELLAFSSILGVLLYDFAGELS